MIKKRKCFFLDRDGVINKNYGHITNIKHIKLLSGVPKGIRFLNKKKYLVIIITNQSAVGRGLISEHGLKIIHRKILKNLKIKNAKVNDIFYCPNHPKFGIGKYKKLTSDRKPGNGMIEKAIKKWKIDRAKSYMIGDQKTDEIAAKKSKIKFFYKKKINFFSQISAIKLK